VLAAPIEDTKDEDILVAQLIHEAVHASSQNALVSRDVLSEGGKRSEILNDRPKDGHKLLGAANAEGRKIPGYCEEFGLGRILEMDGNQCLV